MRYVYISSVKPDEVRIQNKRFWTAQGDRIITKAPGSFTAAVIRSNTQREKREEREKRDNAPVHTRKFTTHKPVDTAMLESLLDFAREMGWSATRTGIEIANDANLVSHIRHGRHTTPARAQRIADRMEELRRCREHSSEKPTPTPS